MRKPSFLLVRHAGAKVLKVKWKMRLFLFDPEVKGTVATYIHCIQIAVCQQASKRSFDFLLNKFVKITCVKFKMNDIYQETLDNPKDFLEALITKWMTTF